MFIAVLFGYLIAALFSFCGLAGIASAFNCFSPDVDYPVFLHTLAQQAWPLAAGIVIFLLVQISVQLEKTAVLNRYAAALDEEQVQPFRPIIARHTPHQQAQPEQAPQESSFFHMEPPPASPPTATENAPTAQAEPAAELKEKDKPQELNFFKIN